MSLVLDPRVRLPLLSVVSKSEEYHGVPVSLCYRLLTNTSCVCLSPFFGSVLHHPPAASQNHLPVPLPIQEPASGYLVQANPHVLFIIELNLSSPSETQNGTSYTVTSSLRSHPNLEFVWLVELYPGSLLLFLLYFFLLARQKLESSEERELQLRKCSYQVSL